jgi:glycosyltransferase involved in cell wall biosynthesis
VIAFDCGNTTDNLIQDMKTGIFARSGDTHDLAKKMLTLYREPELREKIGKQARRFIVSHRSWESRVKTEMEVYKKLLQGKSRGREID